MNGQQIMDAIGYLDDDLIEDADKIRRKTRRNDWMLPAAIAACLCFAVFGIRSQTKSASEAAPGAHDSMADLSYAEVIPEMPMESAIGTAAIHTALLRITQVTDTGFSGVFADADGSDTKAEAIVIVWDGTTVQPLKVGAIVQVRYRTEQQNILIDLTVIEE